MSWDLCLGELLAQPEVRCVASLNSYYPPPGLNHLVRGMCEDEPLFSLFSFISTSTPGLTSLPAPLTLLSIISHAELQSSSTLTGISNISATLLSISLNACLSFLNISSLTPSSASPLFWLNRVYACANKLSSSRFKFFKQSR